MSVRFGGTIGFGPGFIAFEAKKPKMTPKARGVTQRKISKVMQDWRKTGKIGTSSPKTEKEAQKQAIAVGMQKARETGHKVPPPK